MAPERAAPESQAADDPLAGELAALDPALDRSAKILSRDGAQTKAPRDPLIYDPDLEGEEKLEGGAPSSSRSPSRRFWRRP
jgi:hypothetical protein